MVVVIVSVLSIAVSSSGASATSLFSSNSACARFFLGDEICSFSASSSGTPKMMGGVGRRAGGLSVGASSSEALLSSCDGEGCPAFSEIDVCFSSRRAAVVSASSFVVAVEL